MELEQKSPSSYLVVFSPENQEGKINDPDLKLVLGMGKK